jgi:hypothetical protein
MEKQRIDTEDTEISVTTEKEGIELRSKES